MPVERNYCARCGQPVATRAVHGRPRVVCPACETVFYENPLPVAASVVLNARREVLLVKRRRSPHAGMWCLPMGFAELGETIADAARRELHEEAGVVGRVVRLLDADSLPNEHYGDLLIVTFEIEKIGGREQAGDDAEDVRYCPIGQHPPLAFASNEKALQACVAAHQEGWEIHDSLVRLESDAEKALLSDDLADRVEQQAEQIAGVWLADVRANPSTPSYQALAETLLLARATRSLAQFTRWLRGDVADDEVRAFYRDLAGQYRPQGFGLPEVLSALTLLKKHIWTALWTHGVGERPIDSYRVLEFNRRMALFFDKAMYHLARGYELAAAE